MSLWRSSGPSYLRGTVRVETKADPDCEAAAAPPPGCGSGGVLNQGHGPLGSKVRVSKAATQLSSSPVCAGLPVPTLFSGRAPLSQSGSGPGEVVICAPAAGMLCHQQFPTVPG
jgi:hypothetical protein